MCDTDQSDDGISSQDRFLKLYNKKLDTVQKIQVPYAINSQLIPINMEEKQVSTFTSGNSEIETNETGSVRIKIQCPSPDAETNLLKTQLNALTISNVSNGNNGNNGSWSTPSLHVTDCEDLVKAEVDVADVADVTELTDLTDLTDLTNLTDLPDATELTEVDECTASV